MHTKLTLLLAVLSAASVYAWAIANKLAVKFVIDVCVGFLPMPDANSSKFYNWFFGVANFFSANLKRGAIGIGGAKDAKQG
jgi:hypothetical protein